MKSDRLDRIFSRTGGHCHICRKRLCFGNHGAIGKRGAWEIEHSRPRSRGGTDHLNNLYAACISCNRSKGNSTTASARSGNGYRAAPLSEKKNRNAWTGGAVGALAFLFFPPPLRLAAAVVGGIAGAIVGKSYEPD